MGGTGYRAVFVSDLHLGFHLARETAFADWLEGLQTTELVLNGDFLDGWRLRRKFSWNPVRTRIFDRLLAMREGGVRLRIVSGNHDDFLRRPLPRFFDFDVCDQFVHRAAGGQQLLVTHGDLYDPMERRGRWLSAWGSRWFDRISRVAPAGFSFWVKRLSKSVFGRPDLLGRRIAGAARARGLEGALFGHIHRPFLELDGSGFLLGNSGDWIEHASFLAELPDGKWQLHDRGRLVKELSLPNPGSGTSRG